MMHGKLSFAPCVTLHCIDLYHRYNKNKIDGISFVIKKINAFLNLFRIIKKELKIYIKKNNFN